MERNGTTHHRQGTACHNGTVVILFHIVFGKINGLSSCGICCHELKMSTYARDEKLEQELYDLGISDFDARLNELHTFLS